MHRCGSHFITHEGCRPSLKIRRSQLLHSIPHESLHTNNVYIPSPPGSFTYMMLSFVLEGRKGVEKPAHALHSSYICTAFEPTSSS